ELLEYALEHGPRGRRIDQYQGAALPELQPWGCRHVILRQHANPVVECKPASLRDQRSGVFQHQLGCRIPTLALDIERQGVSSAAGLVQQIGCAHDELKALRFAERLSRSILQKGAEQRVILITDFFPALSIGEQMLPIEVLEYLAR